MSYLDNRGNPMLGVGVYTLPQAARLVGLPIGTVESLVGPPPGENTPARAAPIAVLDLEFDFDEKIVTFQGLMDLWVAAELRREGVPWPVIRLAVHEARKVLGTPHPLATGAFPTDGKKVFLKFKEVPRPTQTMLDLIERQRVFEQVLARSMKNTIVVRDEQNRPLKWFPRGQKRSVVLDPERRFGEPIDPETGTPTATLAQALKAEKGDTQAVARWFGVSPKAVRDAAEFEAWLGDL